MFNILEGPTQNAYLALEHISNDGPFESPQGFKRTNIFAKYTTRTKNNNKLDLLYNHSNFLQLYLKSGKGFHSNDSRTVLNGNNLNSIPAAYGTDLGFIWKPYSRIFINSALWYLFLEQEFVYVGDAGIVEPSGRTRRYGLDFSLRYQVFDWLFLNSDLNYTVARSLDNPEGANYIPLAPDFTFTSSAQVLHESGFSGGLHVRHIADRPANEDFSINAIGYTVSDINASYSWSNFKVGTQIQNLFIVEWNETQFANWSRLFSESEPVEEIHFTPGMPRFTKFIFSFDF